MINSSVVAGTTWKCSGTAQQRNVELFVLRAESIEPEIHGF